MRSKTATTCSSKTEVYLTYENSFFILENASRSWHRVGVLVGLTTHAQAQGVVNIKGDETLSEALGRPVTLGIV